MVHAILLFLTFSLVSAVPQKSKSEKTKPPPRSTPKPAVKSAPLPVPAVMDSKVLQQALAGAGGASSTPPGRGALVEAVASGKGRIDYSQETARAVGLGALPPPSTTRSRAQDMLVARDAARADARQALTMALQTDVQRLQEANGESKFLERCAVVFLVDP